MAGGIDLCLEVDAGMRKSHFLDTCKRSRAGHGEQGLVEPAKDTLVPCILLQEMTGALDHMFPKFALHHTLRRQGPAFSAEMGTIDQNSFIAVYCHSFGWRHN